MLFHVFWEMIQFVIDISQKSGNDNEELDDESDESYDSFTEVEEGDLDVDVDKDEYGEK